MVRPAKQEVLCLRDHIGKKTLFVGRSGTEIFIVSELKALPEIDWFELIPLGASSIDLHSGAVTIIADHKPVDTNLSLSELLRAAVTKRLPAENQPVGVFLSGGLDSSIIAALVSSQRREDVYYYTLGTEGSSDRLAVESLKMTLNLDRLRIIPLPAILQLEELLNAVVYATESYNPSIISNGLGAYLLAQAAHNDGVKVVLSGEGADELFGGYFLADEPWQEMRSRLIADMNFTELRRLDLACMAHSVEVRCPMLDKALCGYSDKLVFEDLYGQKQNKVALCNCFKDQLPQDILERQKTSFDIGCGLRGLVVNHLRRNGRSEREELLAIWQNQFGYDPGNPYFHRYPAFDEAIDQRKAG